MGADRPKRAKRGSRAMASLNPMVIGALHRICSIRMERQNYEGAID
jgi:hypothetical protein